jgi:tetratricopeptide (TPR) repeat protein
MRSRHVTLAAAAALTLALGAAHAGDGEPTSVRARSAQAREDAQSLYQKGLEARAKGNEQKALALFRSTVSKDPQHAAARRELGQVRDGGQWIELAEAMRRKGLVRRDGTWILKEEAAILDLPAQEKQRRKDEQAKLYKLIRTYGAAPDERVGKFALQSMGTIEDAYKVEPMAYALRAKNQKVRLLAAKELGRLKNRRAMRPLLHRVIYDPSEPVRHAALDAAKKIGDPNLIAPLVKALGSDDAHVRMRAASGIARAGDVRGIQYLVYKFEAHGGGGPRSYMMSANQLTFIQDFDVEVAQTAFIADPIIGIIQDGVVLDAKVIATEQVSHFVEREAIHGALTRLTGAEDVKNKPGAWAKWWKDNHERVLAGK